MPATDALNYQLGAARGGLSVADAVLADLLADWPKLTDEQRRSTLRNVRTNLDAAQRRSAEAPDHLAEAEAA